MVLAAATAVLPATMFAEPDRNTAKPVVNRWFARADGTPFSFAGIWREWQDDVGTIKQPSVGLHRLYSILTTEPNGVAQPVQLKLQKPANDEAIVITPYDEKKAA